MLFYRRHPPHHPFVDQDNRSNILLLTVCTKDREPILANRLVVELLVKAWLPSQHWMAGKYVVLPDHLHLFCTPTVGGRYGLARWVGSWKSFVSRNWSHAQHQPIWQRSFWDRQMRSGADYDSKWTYVRQIPSVTDSSGMPIHGRSKVRSTSLFGMTGVEGAVPGVGQNHGYAHSG